jgi:hypothetical protein
VIPVVQLYWDRVLPAYVDDEGNEPESSDQVYEDKIQHNSNDEEDQDDQEGQEQNDENEDMEEQDTPCVAPYRTRDSQGIDLTV